jgi:uncharacterized protein (DUF433 family)
MATLSVSERIRSGREMDKLLEAQYRAGVDSREQPLYTPTEAAEYLGINGQTLLTWFFGRTYETKTSGTQFWPAVFSPADPDLKLLSFYNLAEAHVLAATRYDHKVPFPAVRQAIATLIERYPNSADHPLLADDFFTNGKLLFIKTINEVVNISSQQLPLEIMNAFLVRVMRDRLDRPYKIFPLRKGEPDDRVISITAGVSASRPIVDGASIPVAAIWRRFSAGEDVQFIAQDFDLQPAQVERAINYVERRAA